MGAIHSFRTVSFTKWSTATLKLQRFLGHTFTTLQTSRWKSIGWKMSNSRKTNAEFLQGKLFRKWKLRIAKRLVQGKTRHVWVRLSGHRGVHVSVDANAIYQCENRRGNFKKKEYLLSPKIERRNFEKIIRSPPPHLVDLLKDIACLNWKYHWNHWKHTNVLLLNLEMQRLVPATVEWIWFRGWNLRLAMREPVAKSRRTMAPSWTRISFGQDPVTMSCNVAPHFRSHPTLTSLRPPLQNNQRSFKNEILVFFGLPMRFNFSCGPPSYFILSRAAVFISLLKRCCIQGR